jgi:hypothetical protein
LSTLESLARVEINDAKTRHFQVTAPQERRPDLEIGRLLDVIIDEALTEFMLSQGQSEDSTRDQTRKRSQAHGNVGVESEE